MRRAWLWVSITMIVMSLGGRAGWAQEKPYAQGSTSWKKLEGRFYENCSKCHQRLGERLSRPAKEWRGSVHERNGVFCDTCHGGDPLSTVLPVAMGPQNGFMEAPLPKGIPKDCGRCHAEALQSFKESAHGDIFETNDYEPGCVSCHNSHNVSAVSFDLISLDAACGKCHDQNYINETKNPLVQTEQLITQLDARLNALPATDPRVPGMRARLDAARTQFKRLAHYLNENIIRQKKAAVDKELAKLQGMIDLDDTVTR